MKRKSDPNLLPDQLAALSDHVRLRILRVLEREELAVGEVAKVVQLPQSTVSRHLKVLSDSNWVQKRTEGTATLYRLVLDDLAEGGRTIWLAVRGQTPEFEDDTQRLASVLAERREDAQSFFGRVAGQWDDVRNELFGSRFTPIALLNLLPSTWVVADLGCGTGNAAELLAPIVKRVIAIDQSTAMLSAARKRLDGAKNVEFVESDLTKLPLKDASVDAAVCLLVMHHIDEPAAAIREMRRIVRPGGLALVVDMLEHDRSVYKHTMGHKHLGFSAETIRDEFKRAGFASSRYLSLPVDTHAKGPGLFAAIAYTPN